MHAQRPEWEPGTPSFFSLFFETKWLAISVPQPGMTSVHSYTQLHVAVGDSGSWTCTASTVARRAICPVPTSVRKFTEPVAQQFCSPLSSLVSMTTSSEKHALVIVHPKTFVITLHLPVKCPSTSSTHLHLFIALSASRPLANSLLHP